MKHVKAFVLVYVLWLLLGALSKVVFLCVYKDIAGMEAMSDALAVVGHGVHLDMAVAGYLTALPALLLLLGVWVSGKMLLWTWRVCFAVLCVLAVAAYSANVALYGYWGFPLDSTPLLYLKTSPADAFASLTGWQMFGSAVGIIVFYAILYWLFEFVLNPAWLFCERKRGGRMVGRKLKESLVLLILTCALIIPIRGGFGTGTNHTGSVYFSDNMRLNHAAVNPMFSFVESALHREDIGNKFRFMSDEEADKLFGEMVYTNLRGDADADSVNLRIRTQPNVIIVMLESFSKYIMAEGGRVEGVTPRLDAMTKEGIYFDRFYANSVRTDRAIVAIQSGFPAQPSMSIMDMPNKSTRLSSIARSLAKRGYSTSFYYGGDTNYSNMQSYIMGTGYQEVVSEKNFPARMRTSKWGVHDEHVFDRVVGDITKKEGGGRPFLVSIMTLSSHEPFDVPYTSGLENKALNAFAYTDYELGRFVDSLKRMPLWQNTLLVIVPDHLGAYPEDVDNYQLWRYEIPLLMLGGVIEKPQVIHTIGSQVDIAATLLGMLGVEHGEFRYSKDLLDVHSPHFAFFTFPDASFGMVTEENQVLYDDVAHAVIWDVGSSPGVNLEKAKAYVQKLYDDIDGM